MFSNMAAATEPRYSDRQTEDREKEALAWLTANTADQVDALLAYPFVGLVRACFLIPERSVNRVTTPLRLNLRAFRQRERIFNALNLSDMNCAGFPGGR